VSDWLKFVERKVGTALMLDEGQCNGSYSDACVLFSAVLSGIAAELWPGDGFDRRRFVELWIRFADPHLAPSLISIPLLRRSFRDAGRTLEVTALEEARREMFGPGNSCLVLVGDNVDMTEGELVTVLPKANRKELRAYSYPALFYKHIRSNLVHEYKLSEDAASHFATRLQANVSYVNRVDSAGMELSRRLIHFHIEWLANIVRSIASNVAPLIDNYETLPQPPNWWVSG
jgi:hypothetical protein